MHLPCCASVVESIDIRERFLVFLAATNRSAISDSWHRGFRAVREGRTGPTGEIGISAVTALEREPTVDAIVGMAHRPFDPSLRGWVKTTYQQGDILDREAVDALVAQADVVVHLAFIIMGSRCDALEPAPRPGACRGQGRPDIEAGRAVSGHPVAAGPPRRRRGSDRAGGHRSGAAGGIQHRR